MLNNAADYHGRRTGGDSWGRGTQRQSRPEADDISCFIDSAAHHVAKYFASLFILMADIPLNFDY